MSTRGTDRNACGRFVGNSQTLETTQCLPTIEQINKHWSIHIIEHYVAVKGNTTKTLKHTRVWINLRHTFIKQKKPDTKAEDAWLPFHQVQWTKEIYCNGRQNSGLARQVWRGYVWLWREREGDSDLLDVFYRAAGGGYRSRHTCKNRARCTPSLCALCSVSVTAR